MILVLGYIGTGVLAAAAVAAIVGARRASQVLANEREAWPHRERIALLAHKVSKDGDAPCAVKGIVGYLADRAFDRVFAAEILRWPSPPSDQEPLQVRIRREHGDHYAAIILEVLSAMAFVIVLSDRRRGVQMRAEKSNPEHMHEVRVSTVRPIESKIVEKVDFIGPGVHPASALI